jgi:hypothetical protein
LGFILLVVVPPLYMQGNVEATEKGSRVTLTGDMFGNEEQLRRELRAIVTPVPEYRHQGISIEALSGSSERDSSSLRSSE